MNAVERQEQEERRQALRALLRRPLLLATDPDFASVRRHAEWLRDWVVNQPRWALSLTPEYARLRKTPARLDDPTRPARDPRSDVPFTRRRYALFCLVLAALERSERQITLGRLVEALVGELAAAELRPLALESRDDRRDLVHVVRLLVDLGGLRRVVGDESGFVDDKQGDALYNVQHRALSALLDVRVPPSLVEDADRVAGITREPAPDTEAGRHLAIRTWLYRRLLDDPVVYYADMDEPTRHYFLRQRPHIVDQIEGATGLVAEARAEGIAMVDPDEGLSDLRLPAEGTEGHVVLLLAEWLARADGPVGIAAVEAQVRELAIVHRDHWKKETRDPGAEVRFAAGAIETLLAFDLIRRVDGGFVPTAAIRRFRAAPPRAPRLFGGPS